MNIIDTLNQSERDCITIRKFRKGKTVFKENEECFHVVSVISGKLKATSKGPNGQVAVDMYDADSFFGNNLIFSVDPFFRGEIIAKEDSLLAFIPKDEFLKLLSSNTVFASNYLTMLSIQARKKDFHIQLLSFDNAQERLLYYLSENNGTITYNTVTDLSRYLGLSRESLSRLITRLVNSNIISRQEKTITLL